MQTRIGSREVTNKEQGIANLFRADKKKFGRGVDEGANSSVPFEAEHTIQTARERFPDVADVHGKDFELGVVVGVWTALKNLERDMAENPSLHAAVEARGGIPE
jgi:non-canonical (house-cleaning) NTP pyrophosphatase